MVVKANSASLLIPEVEFEIPPKTQTGSINTLEGFLTLSIEELQKDQPARKVSLHRYFGWMHVHVTIAVVFLKFVALLFKVPNPHSLFLIVFLIPVSIP